MSSKSSLCVASPLTGGQEDGTKHPVSKALAVLEARVPVAENPMQPPGVASQKLAVMSSTVGGEDEVI